MTIISAFPNLTEAFEAPQISTCNEQQPLPQHEEGTDPGQHQKFSVIPPGTSPQTQSNRSLTPWWHSLISWLEPPAEGYESIPSGCSVHGEYWIHEDYYLAFVPSHVLLYFAKDQKEDHRTTRGRRLCHQEALLTSSHNILKVIIRSH